MQPVPWSCPECCNPFSNLRLPYIGNCGHSVCQLCTKITTLCPLCKIDSFETPRVNILAVELLQSSHQGRQELLMLLRQTEQLKHKMLEKESLTIRTDWDILTFCERNGIRLGSEESRWQRFKSCFIMKKDATKTQVNQVLHRLQRRYLDDRTNRELYKLEIQKHLAEAEKFRMKQHHDILISKERSAVIAQQREIDELRKTINSKERHILALEQKCRSASMHRQHGTVSNF